MYYEEESLNLDIFLRKFRVMLIFKRNIIFDINLGPLRIAKIRYFQSNVVGFFYELEKKILEGTCNNPSNCYDCLKKYDICKLV